MKTKVQQIGIDRGRELVRVTVKENGLPMAGADCEHCKNGKAVWVDYMGNLECEKCAYHNLKDCEYRWGTVSEFASEELFSNGLSSYHPRPRFERSLMLGMFKGIFLELETMKEGN